MVFPGTEVRLTGLYFPRSSFLPFLKMEVMFPFFQSPGTSPDRHLFFKYDGERLSNHISHLFQNPGMDIIQPHGLIHIQCHEKGSDLFHHYSGTETTPHTLT